MARMKTCLHSGSLPDCHSGEHTSGKEHANILGGGLYNGANRYQNACRLHELDSSKFIREKDLAEGSQLLIKSSVLCDHVNSQALTDCFTSYVDGYNLCSGQMDASSLKSSHVLRQSSLRSQSNVSKRCSKSFIKNLPSLGCPMYDIQLSCAIADRCVSKLQSPLPTVKMSY